MEVVLFSKGDTYRVELIEALFSNLDDSLIVKSIQYNTNISAHKNGLHHMEVPQILLTHCGLVTGAIWPSLNPCTVINPILLTYCGLVVLDGIHKLCHYEFR